jgi:hypothetical protein
MAPKKQAEEQEIKEAAATPDTSDEIAASADPEREQSYLPVLVPIRPSVAKPWNVKMSFIAAFKIDTNLSGSFSSAASAGAVKVKAGKRKKFQGATDTTGDNVDVREHIRAKGKMGKTPRGKRISFSIGKITPEQTLRRGSLSIPSSMSMIAVSHWIDEYWKSPTKPGEFRHNGRSYDVKSIAARFNDMPSLRATSTPKP